MAKFVRKEGQDHGMIDAHQHSPSNWIKKGIYTSPFHRGLCKIVVSELTYSSQLADFSVFCAGAAHYCNVVHYSKYASMQFPTMCKITRMQNLPHCHACSKKNKI